MLSAQKVWFLWLYATFLFAGGRLFAESGHGVKVEQVAEKSAATVAGLQEGDVIISWRRGDANGEIESPFDLRVVEIEQRPRGSVTLTGFRGDEKRQWELGANDWSVSARPMLPEPLLSSYRDGEKLADAGKAPEGAEQWSRIASEVKEPDSSVVRLWLLSHSAELLAKKQQWKQADNFYQQAIQQTAGARPEIAAMLLADWASTFQKRNDWANAEKYYQQSMVESRKLGAESLALAAAINGVGEAVEQNDPPKADDYFHQSLAIREKLAPESIALSESLTNVANIALRRGDLAKAEEGYNRALGIREKIDPAGLWVAASLNKLGFAAEQGFHIDQSEQRFRRALEIEERLAPGSSSMATTLFGLGTVAFDRGDDLDKAHEYTRRALELQEKQTPGGPDVATSLTNLGRVAALRGELDKAEEFHRRALDIRKQLAPESLSVAGSLVNLGVVAAGRRDWDRAAKYYQQGLFIQEKLMPGSLQSVWTLNDLGTAVQAQGELSAAEGYFHRALVIAEKQAPGSFYDAASRGNLGSVAHAKGDLTNAEEYYTKTLEIEDKLAPLSLYTADTLRSLGDVTRARGDLARAEGYYGRALGIIETLAVGSTAHAESLATVAEIMRDKQQWNEAARLFDQALNALETQLSRLGGSQENRSGFRADHDGYYKSYIDLLITQRQPERAFHVLERSRARSLLEMLVEARIDVRAGVDAKLVKQEQSLQQVLNRNSNRRIQLLSGKHTDEQVKALDKKTDDLVAQYQEVEAHIRTSSPSYAALTQPHPLTAKEVQQSLEPDTVLLEYVLGEQRSYVWAVTSDSLVVYELPTAADITRVARELHDALAQPLWPDRETRNSETKPDAEAQCSQAAATLSQMLLQPVASLLQGKRLFIVSDGALQYIPFSVLPDPSTKSGALSEAVNGKPAPLIAGHEIVNLPSASVLSELRNLQAGRNTPAKTLAILADPVFSASDPRVKPGTSSRRERQRSDGSDSPLQAHFLRSAGDIGLGGKNLEFARLPFTRIEADRIASFISSGERMEAVGFEASRATAKSSELSGYGIVHFATHGLLNSAHPELSGLVLSLVDKQGNKQDGFLDLQDIYNMNLSANLVVLSACRTGLGKEIQGEGLVSITRGFMHAGASSVVASLWEVDDTATAHLMEGFYRGMLRDGLRPAAALRRAQIEMSQAKRWSSPHNWAGFVIQGRP